MENLWNLMATHLALSVKMPAFTGSSGPLTHLKDGISEHASLLHCIGNSFRCCVQISGVGFDYFHVLRLSVHLLPFPMQRLIGCQLVPYFPHCSLPSHIQKYVTESRRTTRSNVPETKRVMQKQIWLRKPKLRKVVLCYIY